MLEHFAIDEIKLSLLVSMAKTLDCDENLKGNDFNFTLRSGASNFKISHSMIKSISLDEAQKGIIIMMNTKHIFVLSAFALACVCACIVNLTNYNFEQISLLKEAIGGAHKLNTDVLLLRKNEKNFLTRLNWAEIKKFEANARVLEQDIVYISELLHDKPQLIESLASIEQYIENYKQSFRVACEYNAKIGFDYDHGLRGQLKDRYYQTEDFIRSLDELDNFSSLEYTNKLLALSVHEKNFLIKSSNKYYDRFLVAVKKIFDDIEEDAVLAQEEKQNLKDYFKDYLQTFQQLAEMIIFQQRDVKSPLEELSRSAHDIEYTVRHVSHRIIDEIISLEKGSRNLSSIAMFSFSLGLLALALTPFLSLLFGRHESHKTISLAGVDRSLYHSNESKSTQETL